MAEQIRRLRPGLDVRAAFCEQTSPNLRDVLSSLSGDAVVAPLLLAGAYHAHVDIPAMIADTGARVRQADVLGEDARLLQVMHATAGRGRGVAATIPISVCWSSRSARHGTR